MPRKSRNLRSKPTSGRADELAKHRIAKLAAEKRLIDLNFERQRGLLLEAEDVKLIWSDTIIRLRQEINSWELPVETRGKYLKRIADILRA